MGLFPAVLSRTSFVNTCQWGELTGSPDRLMERHGDAHLYFANRGHRMVILRRPAA
ncbi:hypothetical protein [Streptomyces roseoverticillatus]|uniref:Uncharacterized protein n=1 Tax=Streptomyces roseoverticillatus TaxID=66429 RepID=A0ABV3IY04_9ACTN